ncbi:DUF4340 domain-containing protein [Oscillospiraceae bacterium CM]|nr:DUF4340 domain-containing protein [Oscillospiraceae bacterium CM]
MKKSVKQLLILSAALVICVGAYIGVSVYNANTAKKQAEAESKTALYSAVMGSPIQISCQSAGQTRSYSFENGIWYDNGNRSVSVDQTALDAIASALDSLKAVDTLSAPLSLEVYGLEQPLYTVQAADKDNKEFSLRIGTQTGENYYVQVAGANAVYTIPSALANALAAVMTAS